MSVVDLSVVVPAYNETDRLPATLERLQAALSGSRTELIVVDDGSLDATDDAARRFAAGAAMRVVVLRHERNRGKGAAVRTGFAASRGDRVLVSDADLATPIEELPRLVEAVDLASVAIGSRAVERGLLERRQPWYRDLMGRGFNLLVRVLAVNGIRDTQCGFKLFPGPLARDLAAVQRIDGFAFDVELLAVSRAWGYPIVEVPVRWSHVEASRVHPVRHSLEMLRDLVGMSVRWRLFGFPARPGSAP